MFDAKQETLAKALLDAIRAEKYGHSFYLMAANSTQDSRGKEVFETLAAEELDHARFLQAHYESVLKTGKPSRSVSLGDRAELSEISPIFSDQLRARIQDAAFEMTSLSIGIQLEKDSMAYYREQAEKSPDTEMKQIFEFLSDWEAGHYRALLRQHDMLKEDYWAAGGFAPF
ncbi:MAG: ferritin family protein [Candidatus Zixiibacteriota bacterium]